MSATEISSRSSAIYPRMLGYAVSLAMHVTNVVQITNTIKGELLNDPDIRRFHDDQLKFLTVWNVYLQMFYSALGLSCDVLSLTNEGKDSSLLKTLKGIRDPLFSGLIAPFSCTVSFMFWTVFSYERTLILPASVDRALSATANHVIHTAIVPVVLWEILFRPRRAPGSHVPNLVLMYSYATTYLIVLINSYVTLGAWVYPILNLLNGTMYLYLFLGAAVVIAQIFYYLQWYLTDLFWGNSDDIKKE